MNRRGDESPQITLHLTQPELNIVLAHLGVGRHCDVAEVVQTIVMQASPQLIEAAKVADAEGAAFEALARGEGPGRTQ